MSGSAEAPRQTKLFLTNSGFVEVSAPVRGCALCGRGWGLSRPHAALVPKTGSNAVVPEGGLGGVLISARMGTAVLSLLVAAYAFLCRQRAAGELSVYRLPISLRVIPRAANPAKLHVAIPTLLRYFNARLLPVEKPTASFRQGGIGTYMVSLTTTAAQSTEGTFPEKGLAVYGIGFSTFARTYAGGNGKEAGCGLTGCVTTVL